VSSVVHFILLIFVSDRTARSVILVAPHCAYQGLHRRKFHKEAPINCLQTVTDLTNTESSLTDVIAALLCLSLQIMRGVPVYVIHYIKALPHTHTAVLWPFVQDYPGGLVPEEAGTRSHHYGF